MSGSGGGRNDYYPPTSPTTPKPTDGSGGGGGGGGGGADPCDIVETVPLNSPQPAVVATLNIGDVLDVVLVTTGPRPVLEVQRTGQRAGALTHRNHLRLINCITNGRTYRAVVVRKSGGAVEVRVEPA